LGTDAQQYTIALSHSCPDGSDHLPASAYILDRAGIVGHCSNGHPLTVDPPPIRTGCGNVTNATHNAHLLKGAEIALEVGTAVANDGPDLAVRRSKVVLFGSDAEN
jgi:hypothetical protein